MGAANWPVPRVPGPKLSSIDLSFSLLPAAFQRVDPAQEVEAGRFDESIAVSTVIGDAVSLASRLGAVNKVYGIRILIRQATAEAIGARLELRDSK